MSPCCQPTLSPSCPRSLSFETQALFSFLFHASSSCALHFIKVKHIRKRYKSPKAITANKLIRRPQSVDVCVGAVLVLTLIELEKCHAWDTKPTRNSRIALEIFRSYQTASEHEKWTHHDSQAAGIANKTQTFHRMAVWGFCASCRVEHVNASATLILIKTKRNRRISDIRKRMLVV